MDPYSGLAKIIKDSSKGENNLFIGEVISPRPNIKIRANGIELNKNNLLVSDFLTNDIPENKILNVGSKVLVIKVNKTYIAIAKVVSP